MEQETVLCHQMMLLPQSSPLPGLQCCCGKRDIDTSCVAPPHRPNGDTQTQPTVGWVNPGLGSLLPHVQRPSCHVVTSLGGGEREAQHNGNSSPHNVEKLFGLVFLF